MAFPDNLKWFKRSEFRHPDHMDARFLVWLDKLRDAADLPFVITSDARFPLENLGASGSSSTSLHLVTGDKLSSAVDIITPEPARRFWKLVEAVIKLAPEAKASVEFEPAADGHTHIGLDYRLLTPVHEFILGWRDKK